MGSRYTSDDKSSMYYDDPHDRVSVYSDQTRNGYAPSIASSGRLWAQYLAQLEKDHGLNPRGTARDTPDRGRDGFDFITQIQAQREREIASGLPPRELGLTWKNLTVKVPDHTASPALHENFLSQLHFPRRIREALYRPRETPTRALLRNSHGCVQPGEMLLVLGRPGAGCSTLMQILANRDRSGYASVAGEVHYGCMDAETARAYAGQICLHVDGDGDAALFPTLTVGETIDFATRLKVPAQLPDGVESEAAFRAEMRDFLLKTLGLEHACDTKIGNDTIPGVSSDERRNVAIAECLATRGSVFCWDNSTRGLDAGAALRFIKTLRAFTDILGLTTVVTLQQVGNAAFEHFDKVLVLAQGEQVYYGPRDAARPFMEGLGFVCREGGNVADFLTGATGGPEEREIRPGCEITFPRSPYTLRRAYQKSPLYPQMAEECLYPRSHLARYRTRFFQRVIAHERSPRLRPRSPYTVGYPAQIGACLVREYQITLGNKWAFALRQLLTVVLALILGSLFYNEPANSEGLFLKSGAIFCALLFNTLGSLAEVARSFRRRSVLLRYQALGFHHPVAHCLAQMVADVPLVTLQVTLFSLVLYFMIGFNTTAGAFFTFWAVLFVTTLTTTAVFRALAAMTPSFNRASKWSIVTVGVLSLYTGYMITYHQMHPWFVWIYYLNPLAYASDALLSNELHGTTIACADAHLIPRGSRYRNAEAGEQSCAGVGGAVPGQTVLAGEAYLASLNYGAGHIWRNFAILWPLWVFFVAVTIFCTTRWRWRIQHTQTPRVPREMAGREKPTRADAEAQLYVVDAEKRRFTALRNSGKGRGAGSSARQKRNVVDDARSVFTWKDLSYTVPTPAGERVLLDRVEGWIQPGMLGAIMGAPDEGDATLLEVLARRATRGWVQGTVCLGGRPFAAASAPPSVGYCERRDAHEALATVRETLEFSARLRRRDRDAPRADKLQYVDTVLDLLELRPLEHALVGRPGVPGSLSPEQRKHLSIAVELVARPRLLLLDEPTLGMDGCAAHNTARILRKLADAGHAVVVTLHRPSAAVFAQFDTLFLLDDRGRMAYSGEIGPSAQSVKGYFARHGAPCLVSGNPATYLVDVASGPLTQDRDWAEVWTASSERAQMASRLQALEQTALATEPPASQSASAALDPAPAAALWLQLWLVTLRTSVTLYRNTDYLNGMVLMHVGLALFNGFSFWQIDSSIAGLQSRLFTIFAFIFLAVGMLSKQIPLVLERRALFERRDARTRSYGWFVFCVALVVAELPYLLLCTALYFVCWYWTVGLGTGTGVAASSSSSSGAGPTFLVMVLYELLVAAAGHVIAAAAASDGAAAAGALASPVLLGILVPFCGVLVPPAFIPAAWRTWLYPANPLTHLMRGLLAFTLGSDGARVACAPAELAVFAPPANTTCEAYLSPFFKGAGKGAVLLPFDPNTASASASCRVCQYRDGTDYLRTLNVSTYADGWRSAGIVAAFAAGAYLLFFLAMAWRSRRR